MCLVFTEITQIMQNTLSLDYYKNELLRTISHDLKTPLNGMMTFLQGCQASKDIIQIYEYLDMIEKNGYLLEALINDITDYCIIQKQQLQLSIEDFDVEEAIHEVVELYKYSAENKGIKIDVIFELKNPDNILILNDKIRFKQILVNILGNSVKFTQQGSIQIKVAYSQDIKCLEIIISDTGVGIDQKMQGKLFKLFGCLQVDEDEENNSQDLDQLEKQQKHSVHGAGFGLTISRLLVDQLGPFPNIFVESEVGQGSTFSFFILEDFYKREEINKLLIAQQQEQLDSKLLDNYNQIQESVINQGSIQNILTSYEKRFISQLQNSNRTDRCQSSSNIKDALVDEGKKGDYSYISSNNEQDYYQKQQDGYTSRDKEDFSQLFLKDAQTNRNYDSTQDNLTINTQQINQIQNNIKYNQENNSNNISNNNNNNNFKKNDYPNYQNKPNNFLSKSIFNNTFNDSISGSFGKQVIGSNGLQTSQAKKQEYNLQKSLFQNSSAKGKQSILFTNSRQSLLLNSRQSLLQSTNLQKKYGSSSKNINLMNNNINNIQHFSSVSNKNVNNIYNNIQQNNSNKNILINNQNNTNNKNINTSSSNINNNVSNSGNIVIKKTQSKLQNYQQNLENQVFTENNEQSEETERSVNDTQMKFQRKSYEGIQSVKKFQTQIIDISLNKFNTMQSPTNKQFNEKKFIHQNSLPQDIMNNQKQNFQTPQTLQNILNQSSKEKLSINDIQNSKKKMEISNLTVQQHISTEVKTNLQIPNIKHSKVDQMLKKSSQSSDIMSEKLQRSTFILENTKKSDKLNKYFDTKQSKMQQQATVLNQCLQRYKRVLVVDDTMFNIMGLLTLLKKSPHLQNEQALNGEQAVNKYKESIENKQYYDIIFMDINMPVLDGIQAIKQIRQIQNEKNAYKPLILTNTAYCDKGDRDQSLQAGADEHITKPIHMDKLIKVLTEIQGVDLLSYQNQQQKQQDQMNLNINGKILTQDNSFNCEKSSLQN